MPAPGQILFTGSSSIRTWKTLQEDMAPLQVINRGFGGAHIEHVTHWADRIVTPYAPRAIVLYAGDNDIHYKKTPERVAADFEAFVATVRSDLPEVPIYFLTIKPSPARWASWPNMQEANRLIQTRIDADDTLYSIDVSSPLLEAGDPKPELYISDGLHLSAAGFATWTAAVKPVLTVIP